MSIADTVFRLFRDKNERTIQCPTHPVFQDATETPNVSGATTNRTTLTLKVPPGALRLDFTCSAAVKYGTTATQDGSAGNGFRTLSASAEKQIYVGNVANVYLIATGDNFDIEFEFQMGLNS